MQKLFMNGKRLRKAAGTEVLSVPNPSPINVHVAHLNEMTVIICNRYCAFRYVFGKPPKNQQMDESEGMTGWIDDLSGTTEPGQGTCLV